MNIGYLTEPAEGWQRAIEAETLADLRTAVKSFELVAWDAVDIINAMTPQQFKSFRRGLLKERKQEFAGTAWAEKFAAVLIPETMMRVHLVADQFKVPWGCAFIRLRDEGMVTVKEGRAYYRGERP